MVIWVIERWTIQLPTGDRWEPVRDTAGLPLAYTTRKGAQRALSSLPHHFKGQLVHYRITLALRASASR